MLKKLVVLVALLAVTGIAMAEDQLGTPGLVACWNWDNGGFESSGRGAPDNATFSGAPLIADPYGQKGMVLDLTLGSAFAAGTGKWDFNKNFTLSIWVAPLDRNGNGLEDEVNEQWKFITGQAGGWGPRAFSMNSGGLYDSQLWYDYGGWQLDGWTPNQAWRGSDWLIDNTGPWHNVVYTRDGTTKMERMWVDGVGNIGWDVGPTIGDWYVNWSSWNFGQTNPADSTGWLLDSVCVWNGVCTDEVAAGLKSGLYDCYNAPIPEPATMTLLALGALGLIRRK